MQSNAKKNEHPSCSCFACRTGRSTTWGKYVHRQTNRSIRHQSKIFLSLLKNNEEYMPVMRSTAYTD